MPAIKMNFIVLLVGFIHIGQSVGINRIDLTSTVEEKTNVPDASSDEEVTKKNIGRRYWLVSGGLDDSAPHKTHDETEEDKDENIKSKISTLVEQTLYDSQVKIKSLATIKELHKEDAPYKAGFILSLIKKSKDVLNELFNVAIRHKDDWKALEQLKVFELIVHTNVDTTNLVRQLVEVHIQYMNATNTGDSKKRVVLLK